MTTGQWKGEIYDMMERSGKRGKRGVSGGEGAL